MYRPLHERGAGLLNHVSSYIRQHMWASILAPIAGAVTMEHPWMKKGTTCCLHLEILASYFWICLVFEYPYTRTHSVTVTLWEIRSPNPNQVLKYITTVYRKGKMSLPVDWWVGGGSVIFFCLCYCGNHFSVAILINVKIETQNIIIRMTPHT